MLEEALTSESSLITYLNASRINNEAAGKRDIKHAQKTMHIHKKEACHQLERWLRQDICILAEKYVPYVVRFRELYGVLTVSNRHSLFLVDEIDYPRELAPDELHLLPYLGALHGLKYMKQLDIESAAYTHQRESFKGVSLSSWLPHADYAYYAWNVGGYAEREHIFLDKTSDSLPSVISFLGHEAGHYFGSVRSKTSEEYNCIEETFCDQFAIEYVAYFKRKHAGSYASQFTSQKSSDVPSIINTVEKLLHEGKQAEAETFLQQSRVGNQAYLLHMKRYSCDEVLQKNVAQLFSLCGAKSILLLPSIATKKRLEQLVTDAAKGISFSELQKR